jgi:hypothetical protein
MWTENEQNDFDAIKELISTKCMGYFPPKTGECHSLEASGLERMVRPSYS